MDRFEAWWFGKDPFASGWLRLSFAVPVVIYGICYIWPPLREYGISIVALAMFATMVTTFALATWTIQTNLCARCKRHNFGVNLQQTDQGRICKRCLMD